MEPQAQSSFLAKAFNPILQAGVALASILIFIGVAKLIDLTGLMEVEANFPWLTAAAFLLLFALFNSISFLSSKNTLKYWGRSMYSFMGLALGAGTIAWITSQVPISEAGSYWWIFIVVAVSYVVFLTIMNLMKRIVEFAQKEEWNQPRIRNKNRR